MLHSVNSHGLSGKRPDVQSSVADQVAPISAVRAKNTAIIPLRRCIAALALAEGAGLIAVAPLAMMLDDLLGDRGPIFLYLVAAFVLAVAVHLFYRQMELYSIETLTQFPLQLGKLWGGLLLSVFVIHGALYLFRIEHGFSRTLTVFWFLASAVAIVLVRWIGKRQIRSLADRGVLRYQVALVGTANHIAALEEQLDRSSGFCEVTGRFIIDDGVGNDALPGASLAVLQEVMERRGYDLIVIGIPAAKPDLIQSTIKSLSGFSAELLLCSEIKPINLMVHETRFLGRIRADIINIVPKSERNRFVKRVLDCSIAAAGLVLLSPLLAIVALAIKLDTPGPVFFRQRRYGQNNRVFRIFKFRTMRVTEDGVHVKQAERHDDRVTRVGRILRATSLDEIPQLINVLFGDMSLVGPRPHALVHDQLFEEKLDLFSSRRRVQPGLTGWAQVNGYRGETRTTEDIRRRLEHDLYYIENWSIWFDIEIILRTALVVWRGAY
ncbi:exopolysaccharide biosynthesis polyprenyl glycosylphosphotransferase [Hyphomicrobium sp.]|uniref:exopolysaccharide biosynthesis polyprenyl glycosylphosphotransferase n=1 Tax=Hyphomicrobium sp. TaxID=82 RepID=UPI002E32A540|nr:exopolysaccharide biosynthesis polyprenyl glycosylphosphotransferase [Hyphomicrobium sp.]HEX2842508.1 exopolysaccharide biosynthesis polyprenyl glycosylphosphotransferase [Hyphomicrobium sp.]